jgi:hypothetical protein
MSNPGPASSQTTNYLLMAIPAMAFNLLAPQQNCWVFMVLPG